MNLRFVNLWALYLLWLVPLLAFWWYTAHARAERVIARFVSTTMQQKLRPRSDGPRSILQTVLVIASIFFLLVALARPQWGMKEQLVTVRARNLVIALDVSASMRANDVHPNRLGRAKADIMDLVRELDGDRAALIAFRHKAVMLCPLTTDYAYLKHALDPAGLHSAPAGPTDIGDAIVKALSAFKNDPGSHRAVILVSDGEDLTDRALEAAGKAAEQGIPVFTVGLGSISGSKIPDPRDSLKNLQYNGKDIVTSLNNKTLRAIAMKTGAAYVPVGTSGMAGVTLGTLYRNHLSKLAAKGQEELLQHRHIERFQFFLLPSILLLLAAAALSRGRLVIKRETASKTSLGPIASVLLAAMFLGTNTASAQEPPPKIEQSIEYGHEVSARKIARDAQALYSKGQHVESAAAYNVAAARSSGTSSREFLYNAAAALYEAGQYGEAAKLLRELNYLADENRARLPLGLGTALYRAADTNEPDRTSVESAEKKAELTRLAGDAFRQALSLEPDNRTAAENLAIVMHKLPGIEDKARIKRLLQQYEKTPASVLAHEMLSNQRAIIDEMPPAMADPSPSAIWRMEKLAERQRFNADLWIPLKGKLAEAISKQSMTDEQRHMLASFERAVESLRDDMHFVADALRDIKSKGYPKAVAVEAGIYQLWKGVAAYAPLLAEGIRRQTNAISLHNTSTTVPQRLREAMSGEQDEVNDLTLLFKRRFLEAFPEGEQPEKKDTGNLSPEDRQKILDLTDEAVTVQENISLLMKNTPLIKARANQERTAYLLHEIQNLLPKEPSENSDQDNEPENKPEQQDPQNNQQPDPKQKEQANNDEPQENPNPAQNENEDMSEDEMRQLLEKAMQREKEHLDEKRRRALHNEMPPIGMDY